MGKELFSPTNDEGAKVIAEIRQAVVELVGVKLSDELRGSVETFVREAFGLVHGKVFDAEFVHNAQVVDLLADLVDGELFAVYRGLMTQFNLASCSLALPIPMASVC
jgi:hypothetical protein